jgi:hypothetical protein
MAGCGGGLAAAGAAVAAGAWAQASWELKSTAKSAVLRIMMGSLLE